MNVNRRTAAVATGAALLGMSIGFAGPASADAPDGRYIATVVDGGVHMEPGGTQAVEFTSCGPDCIHINRGRASTDLRLQGAAWTGTYAADQSFGPCTLAVDVNNLNLIEQCPSFDLNVLYSLTRS